MRPADQPDEGAGDHFRGGGLGHGLGGERPGDERSDSGSAEERAPRKNDEIHADDDRGPQRGLT